MDFNLDTTYGSNNDIHNRKIIKYKPNNLATMNSNVNVNGIGETWLETHSDSDDRVWSENNDSKAWSGTHRCMNIFSETKQRDKPCSQCGCGGVRNVGVGTSGLGSPSNL